MQITRKQLVDAFVEWERRVRETPDVFLSEKAMRERDIANGCEQSIDYLLGIINEQRSKA